jgi:hypothetical protein
MDINYIQEILKGIPLALGMSLPFLLPIIIDRGRTKHYAEEYGLFRGLDTSTPSILDPAARREVRHEILIVILKWRDLMITSVTGVFAIALSATDKLNSNIHDVAQISLWSTPFLVVAILICSFVLKPEHIQGSSFIKFYVLLVGLPYLVAFMLTYLHLIVLIFA